MEDLNNNEVTEKENTSQILEDVPVSNEKAKEESYAVDKEPTKSGRKIGGIVAIFLSLIFLVIAIFSVIFALLNINNTCIISGVTIKGIDVAGLSREEAVARINQIINPKLKENIVLTYQDTENTMIPEQISTTFDIENAVNKAYEIGRSGNIFANNYEILKRMFSTKDIDIDFSFNMNELDTLCSGLSEKLPDCIINSSYYVEEGNLIITKGKQGKVVKTEELGNLITTHIQNILEEKEPILIPVETKDPDPIDIDRIYSEVKKDPIDAYYTSEPFEVHPHVDGIDFGISLEEAKQIIAEEKEEYVIPLKTITPKVTTNQIGTEAFPDLLSSFSTKYAASNVNRTTNLRLAASKIDGTVLMPGEVFSYNKVVGKRTIQAGYKDAAIFQGGKVVDGLGGGICQISSTLYNSVLLANLEIVERRNHGFVTSYLEAGRDATVVYGSIDFQFKNNRNYPVKITSSVSGGVATFNIYGKKEDVEYEVSIETKRLQTTPFGVSYINDPNLAVGKTRSVQGGMNGCKTETYKILKLNGKVVESKLLSKDTYSPMTKIIARGTREY